MYLVSVSMKDNSPEANLYTWLQSSNDYLAVTDDNYINRDYTRVNCM